MSGKTTSDRQENYLMEMNDSMSYAEFTYYAPQPNLIPA
jgi:hypothetical protein